MSFASASSSTSSVIRSAAKSRAGRICSSRFSEGVSPPPAAPGRSYSAAAAVQQDPHPPPLPHNTSRSSGRFPRRPSSPPTSTPSLYSSTTPQMAQSYLSDLLHLPPSRSFPPDLALQILTHKSYRYVHPIKSRTSLSTPTQSLSPDASPLAVEAACAAHNARLSFLGRRALATYLAMFIHDCLARASRPGVPFGNALKEAAWLKDKSLESRLEDLRHANNLGREVGDRWGVQDVMRWDRNQNGLGGGNVKIKGLTVEAILGGVFTEHGSPAAQRAFHLHVLPYLVGQFKDARISESAEALRKDVRQQLGGGIVEA